MSDNDTIRCTILEMFGQRGYQDIENKATTILAQTPDGESVCAFVTIIGKLNVAEIHSHIAIMQEGDIKHGLLVYEGTPTPVVKNVVASMADMGIIIELFDVIDLRFNITKHELVPEHVVLSKEDSKKFKAKHGSDIPIILKSDPIARFYDFRRGDVVKVIRRGGFVSYRIIR